MSRYYALKHQQQSTESALMLSTLPSTSSETLVQQKLLIKKTERPIPVDNWQDVSRQTWIEVLLRALGLSILWNACCSIAHRPRAELGKQAMRRSRLHVCMSLSTHILPMAACIALLVLNLRGYYVGGELGGPIKQDDVTLNTLQFAAKLHELTMQASLSLIIVAFVRHELAVGRGVPLGAIFGSLQLSQVNYLWSKEFVGALKARTRSSWTKWSLITIIFIGAIQFVTVGPASAILMRPRLDNWPAGGTASYLNATREQIWPDFLRETDVSPGCAAVSSGTPSECISKHWALIRDSFVPFWIRPSHFEKDLPSTIDIPSSKTLAMRALTFKSNISRMGGRSTGMTVATVQTSVFADVLSSTRILWVNAAGGNNETSIFAHSKGSAFAHSKGFESRRDVAYTIDNIYQPLTSVICKAFRDVAEDRSSPKFGPISQESLCDLTHNKSEEISWTSYDHPVELPPILEHYNGTSTSSRLRFVDLREDRYGTNSVGAFISLPNSWPGGRAIYACSIDARWAPTSISSRKSRPYFVESDPPGWLDGVCSISGSKKIKISQGWANMLNPRIEGVGQTVFENILQKVHDQDASAVWSNDMNYTQPLMEHILSMLVTDGLANAAASTVSAAPPKGCTIDNLANCTLTCSDGEGAWCREILPKGVFGPGGDIYDLPPDFNASKGSQFTVHVEINGYAYNSRGITARLACAVLICYCLLALGHFFFSLWSGLSSHSWDTVAEVVALAMQSQPTAALKKTCAGIVSTSIFTNLVRIVETGEEGEHLELIFEADHDYEVEAVPNKLQPDKFYF